MIKIYSMHKLLSYVNSLIVALLFTVVLLAGCKKNELPPEEIFVRAIPLDGSIIYPTTQLDSISLINKSTSWFNTNKAFDELFDVKKSLFSGFELGLDNKFYPFNYTNEKQALRLLKTGLKELTSKELGESIKPALAKRGDVVLIHRGEMPALAICDGSMWHGAGLNKMETGQMLEAICAWKVGK